jgi:hypothetical protein
MSRRKRILLVVAAAVVLLAGAIWVVGQLGFPQALALEVSGEPGREVVGPVEVDGVSQPLAGTLPVRFEYRGSRIEYGEQRLLSLVVGRTTSWRTDELDEETRKCSARALG